MGFQKFTSFGCGKRNHSTVPETALSKHGQIRFLEVARQKYHIEDFQAIALYFDQERCMVGVKLLRQKEDDSTALRHRSRQSELSGKAFTTLNSIDITETQRYLLSEEDLDGEAILVFGPVAMIA